MSFYTYINIKVFYYKPTLAADADGLQDGSFRFFNIRLEHVVINLFCVPRPVCHRGAHKSVVTLVNFGRYCKRPRFDGDGRREVIIIIIMIKRSKNSIKITTFDY